jgi:23S rRNA (cytosine1962-C5)-methyltransferase
MLRWVRENAALSDLPEDCMRILVDDAAAFVRREARRGSRYHVVLLDPPHQGKGPKGEKWRFESGIAPLLGALSEILEDSASVVLSTYAIGFSPLSLANLMGSLGDGSMDVRELALPEGDGEPSGRLLPAGFCARWTRGSAEGA